MSEVSLDEKDLSDDKKDLFDWSEKYDISLNVLQHEYSVYIDTIRNCDEKANKYLVVISIFIAGLFTILASSFIDKLEFNFNPLDLVSLLSLVFIGNLILIGRYGFKIIFLLLDCLDFVKTRRMPDLLIQLKFQGETNSTEYKYIVLIRAYQEAINYMEGSIEIKQNKIRSASKRMKKFIILIVSSMLILFFIKLIG